MAEATVYLAFPDKAALLDAVIVRAMRDNPSEPLDAIAAAPPRRRSCRASPPPTPC